MIDFTTKFNIDRALELLENAKQSARNGDYGNCAVLVQNAVSNAIGTLEIKSGIFKSGEMLFEKFSTFTDDSEIINAARVIDDFFSPLLYPVGFDTATSEPDISADKAQMAIRYGEILLSFVENKIKSSNK